MQILVKFIRTISYALNQIRQTSYSKSGRPVDFCCPLYAPEEYKLTYQQNWSTKPTPRDRDREREKKKKKKKDTT